ncbi:MAG: ATP-binding protein [Dehalococcoidia bacterium]
MDAIRNPLRAGRTAPLALLPLRHKLGLHVRAALFVVAAAVLVNLILVLFVVLASSYLLPDVINGLVTDPPSGTSRLEPGGGAIHSTEHYGNTIVEQVRSISIAGLALSIPIVGMAAYWAVRRGLRPVRELDRAVSLMKPDTLAVRVPVPEANDEIRSLALAFNTMLDRLEHSFDRQRSFVADAAHELRTPVSILKTSVEVALADDGERQRDVRDTLRAMQQSLVRLEDLTRSLLLLADDDVPLGEPVVLGPLIEEVKSDLHAFAAERKVTVELGDLDAEVLGDGGLLARAFYNLVHNAIVYNRPGGKVLITAAKNTGRVTVSICDTGVGIPASEQSSVLERFYRVDRSRSQHSGGAGLGLAITSHIVGLHGGTVDLQSEPGDGTMVRVNLPVSRSIEDEVGREAMESHRPAPF